MPIQIREDRLPQPGAMPVPEVAEAIKRFNEARHEESEARQRAVELEHALPQAQQADIELRADAFEAGKKSPGSPNEDKQQKQIAEAQRDYEALKVVRQRRFRDLAATVDAHEQGLKEAADAKLAIAREVFEEAVAAVAQAHAGLQTALQLNGFVRDGNWRGGFASQVGVRHLDGLAVEEILAALLKLSAPPEQRQQEQGAGLTLVENVASIA